MYFILFMYRHVSSVTTSRPGEKPIWYFGNLSADTSVVAWSTYDCSWRTPIVKLEKEISGEGREVGGGRRKIPVPVKLHHKINKQKSWWRPSFCTSMCLGSSASSTHDSSLRLMHTQEGYTADDSCAGSPNRVPGYQLLPGPSLVIGSFWWVNQHIWGFSLLLCLSKK